MQAPKLRFSVDLPKCPRHSCIPDLFEDAWYQNAPRNASPVPSLATIGGGPASNLVMASDSTVSPTAVPSAAQESQAQISLPSHQKSSAASPFTISSFIWAVSLSFTFSFAA